LAFNRRAHLTGAVRGQSAWYTHRIRNRFEPHENMFPGLSKLPAMSRDQLRAVDEAHKATGHKTYGKTDEGNLQPTRPFGGSPSQMGYLGLGGLAALPALMQDRER
jgi:hypothetical protein